MGHFGLPEPPAAGIAPCDGLLEEGDTVPEVCATPDAHDASWANPADLVGCGSLTAPVQMQESMDESGTTSFVLRASPFGLGPAPAAPGTPAMRLHDLSIARTEAEEATLSPCDEEAPEESWDQQGLDADGHQTEECLVDEESIAPLQVPRGIDGGASADDTDAEPLVQPLRPRTRGLPGNTGDGKGIRSDKKARAALDKQPLAPPSEVPGRPGASPLLDINLTVAEAAAAVSLRDLAELRSFRNPPAVVCQVLEAVAVLLGMTDVRWAKMRKLLDKDFIGRVRSFNPASTTPAQAERLAVLLQVPTFSDGLLGDRCPAVLSLAAWCNTVGRQLQAPLPKASPPPMPLPVPGRRNETEASPGAKPDQLDELKVEPDLWSMDKEELARVQELRISREGVGAVTFHGVTDCRSLLSRHRLSDLIVLNPGEVIVYPNQSIKPAVGMGLNKAASVVLYGCLPKAQGFRDKRARERYKRRVKQMTEDKGAEFVDYDCDEGVWQFKVVHF